MSIKVTLGRPRGEPMLLGPFERLIFVGGQLRSKEGAMPIAVHENHAWQVRDQWYSRLDIPGPVMVLLSSPPAERTFGPFTSFSCVDGVAYTENRVFAFVDNEQGDWYCVEDGRHWKALETREKAQLAKRTTA
jgi:hypothetical protein